MHCMLSYRDSLYGIKSVEPLYSSGHHWGIPRYLSFIERCPYFIDVMVVCSSCSEDLVYVAATHKLSTHICKDSA